MLPTRTQFTGLVVRVGRKDGPAWGRIDGLFQDDPRAEMKREKVREDANLF